MTSVKDHTETEAEKTVPGGEQKDLPITSEARVQAEVPRAGANRRSIEAQACLLQGEGTSSHLLLL